MTSRPDGGYSLLELIVVMAIVAIAASASMTTFRPQNTEQTPAYLADRFVLLLNTARLKAIEERRKVVVTLSFGKTKMLKLDGVEQFFIDDTITGLRALSGKRENDSSTDASFVFFPEGRATGGGFEFDDGLKTRKVNVNWLTGMVSQSQSVRVR